MKKKPLRLIPRGMYCYKIISVENNILKTKNCPYREIRNDKPKQMNGYCNYLEAGDWEGDGMGLIWDGCKECNIKFNYGKLERM